MVIFQDIKYITDIIQHYNTENTLFVLPWVLGKRSFMC